MSEGTTSDFVEVSGLRLHYVSAGEGDPVLLLHGWPTSSYLWRNVMPSIAENNRVIAIDLPGFGQSDKPLNVSYSFRFFDEILTGFLDALEIDRVSLAVHDLGGPAGTFWATSHPERLRSIAFLNTLIYPETSWAVKAFVLAVRMPGLRRIATSPWTLEKTMRLGVGKPKALSPEVVERVQAPFRTSAARRALAKTGCNFSPKGFAAMARKLPNLECPVRIVYGTRDRLLPDVSRTMSRLKRDLPQAELTALRGCGHFLQEDQPEEVGRLLAEFFAP